MGADLGPLRYTCTYSKGMGGFMIVLALASTGIGLFITIGGTYDAIAHPSASVTLGDIIAGTVVGLIFLLIGVGVGLSTFRETREGGQIFIHEGGVRYVSRSKKIEVGWDGLDFLTVHRS